MILEELGGESSISALDSSGTAEVVSSLKDGVSQNEMTTIAPSMTYGGLSSLTSSETIKFDPSSRLETLSSQPILDFKTSGRLFIKLIILNMAAFSYKNQRCDNVRLPI